MTATCAPMTDLLETTTLGTVETNRYSGFVTDDQDRLLQHGGLTYT